MNEKIYSGTELDPESLRDIADKIVNDKKKTLDFYDKLRSKFTAGDKNNVIIDDIIDDANIKNPATGTPPPEHRIPTTEHRQNALTLKDFLFLLPDFFILLIRLFTDKRVEKHKKIFLSCIIGYLVLPIDLIPDFIPTIGFIDDFVIIILGLDILLTDIPKHIIYENWSGRHNILDLISSIVEKIENTFYKSMFSTIKNLLKSIGKYNERNSHSHSEQTQV